MHMIKDKVLEIIWQQIRDRFWAKVDKSGECWEWKGAKNQDGYGMFAPKTFRKSLTARGTGRLYTAHRFAYEDLVGPIDVRMVIDHLCRNRACVRPEHMQAVLPGVNTLRGYNPFAINGRKSHCHKGHEFTPENTYINPQDSRVCRECMRTSRRTGRPYNLRETSKTHCPQGHPYDEANTRWYRNHRYCRACSRNRKQR
jgi:hypothetical protein